MGCLKLMPAIPFTTNISACILSLTHWGRVTHICVSKLTIIGSDNGLSPDRRQAIIWTNAGILLIGPLGTNFSETLIEILKFSFNEMRMKVSSAKRLPFCLGLNVLIIHVVNDDIFICIQYTPIHYHRLVVGLRLSFTVLPLYPLNTMEYNLWMFDYIISIYKTNFDYFVVWIYI